MPADFPLKNLDDVDFLSRKVSPDIDICHVFGIFKEEIITSNAHYWVLFDEFRLDGVRIKLGGPLDDYPKPAGGDIVRIHRLKLRTDFQEPLIPIGRNVVVWPAFKYQSFVVSKARHPTIEDSDNQKRRQLEDFFCSTLSKIQDIKNKLPSPGLNFVNVAGRVESTNRDRYENIEIEFFDGTGKFIIRLFPKRTPLETNLHFDTALELKPGDLFVAFSARVDPKGRSLLDLSANLKNGRWIRQVESESILGLKLRESFRNSLIGPSANKANLNESVPQQQESTNSNNNSPSKQDQQPLRRSPRFAEKTLQTDISMESRTEMIDQNHNNHESIHQDLRTPTTTYIKLSEIKMDQPGFFKFYDIAGQIRGKPNKTRQYDNYVFQLYDGSNHKFKSFFVGEVEAPVSGAVVILVYSKQRDQDTDEHTKKVEKLNDGDLVLIKNIKVSFKNDCIKLELSANLVHGKSINVVDRNSPLGLELLERVTNPIVEELEQSPLDSSLESYETSMS